MLRRGMTSKDVKLRGGTLTIMGRGRAAWHPGGRVSAQIDLRFAVDRAGRTSVREVRVASPHRVEAALLRQIPLGAIEDVMNGVAVGRADEADKATAIRPVKSYRVGSRRDDDSFYKRLTQLYTAAGTETPHPAQRLADDNGVSRRTVTRWLAEARRRGFMNPTRKAATDRTKGRKS